MGLMPAILNGSKYFFSGLGGYSSSVLVKLLIYSNEHCVESNSEWRVPQ